jgi:hypothetical protein
METHYCTVLIGGQTIFSVKPLYLPDIAVAAENDVIQHPGSFSYIKITHIQILATSQHESCQIVDMCRNKEVHTSFL